MASRRRNGEGTYGTRVYMGETVCYKSIDLEKIEAKIMEYNSEY